MESGSYFYPGIYKLTPPPPGTSFVTGTVTVCLEPDSQPVGPSSPTAPSAGSVVSFGEVPQPIYGDVNIANSALSVTGSIGVVGTPNVSIVGKPTVTGSVGIVGTTIVSVSGTPTVSVVGTPTVAVTNIPSVSITGIPTVSVTDGTKSTYSAAVVGLAATTTNPSDIFTIYGSATKTIRIIRIGLTGVQTNAGQRDVLLIKRSSINTAGISATVPAVSHDSNNVAATATLLSYTGNPTLGISVGTLCCRRLQVNTANTPSPVDYIDLNYGNRPSPAIVLRGVNEGVAINLNGIASSGNLWTIFCEWTEE
jgi:hypothetical protein